MSIVWQPTERESTRPINPRVIMNSRENLRLTGRRIEQHHPTIFVVGRTRHDDGVLPILGPLQLRQLYVAIFLRWRSALRLNPVTIPTRRDTNPTLFSRIHLSTLDRRSSRQPLPMIDILCLAGFSVDDYEAGAIL